MSGKDTQRFSDLKKDNGPDPALSLKPIVLVTGGSRGIGAALAERFAKAGHEVAIVARDDVQLGATALQIEQSTGLKPRVKSRDITEQGAYASLERELAAEGYYVDVLINNAAIGLSGPFSEHTEEDLERLLALNITALTRTTRSALTGMLLRKRGGVLNVASLGGYAPGPGQALYYASKAFILSLTEALASECSGTGVVISVLAPGPVATTFHKEMQAEDAHYRKLLPELTPKQVAQSAYWRFKLRQRVIVPGAVSQTMQVAMKILPHRVSVPIIGWLLSKSKE